MPDSRPPSPPARVRIIGQGLTGSFLALGLHQMGVPFVVQDVPLAAASTPVAPGIVNPLAGRKFKAPAHLPRLLDQLQVYLDLAQSVLGRSFWHPIPILRLFFDDAQLDHFEEVRAGNGKPFIEHRFPENHFPFLNDHLGSFLTARGGWMDLPAFQESVRRWLSASGRLEVAEWSAEQQQQPDEWLVFCQGWRIANDPAWDFIPHNPARGEMLIVRFEEPLPRDHIYNQACWAQPLGNELWRIGATYGWDDFSDKPSVKAAEDLQERLHLLTPIPFTVLDQLVGVRPIVEDTLPVIGLHPERPRTAVLNAMGSKGVLRAPAATNALLRFLFHDEPLPEDWSVNRFSAPRGSGQAGT